MLNVHTQSIPDASPTVATPREAQPSIFRRLFSRSGRGTQDKEKKGERSLVLFFEYHSSLQRGLNQGVLYRNMAQYERFLAHNDFDRIYWFSYTPSDIAGLEKLRGENAFWQQIELLVPPKWMTGRLGAVIYSILGPFMHWRAFSQADIIKCHQVSGSWTGLIGKWMHGKPFLFRLGYPLSVRFRSEGKMIRHWLTRMLEKVQMRSADHAAVTSNEMLAYYGAMAPKTPITLLPNYVDTTGFTPIQTYDLSRPILFVGRLAPVKNLENLITALGRIGHPLHIYGGGELEDELKAHAMNVGADVTFKGFVANKDLMQIHHDYSVYVLCSTREGMPKTMVEAMASGLLSVGTPVGGILELIDDNRTGYLASGFDAEALEAKLRWVLENGDPDVGRQAAKFIAETHSLDHAVELERRILSDLRGGN